MERLTIEYQGEYVPKELCSIDRMGKADDCDLCCECCKATKEGIADCSECAINRCFNKLGAYEDTGVTPEQLKIIDEEYSRMVHELEMLRQQNQWIAVSVRLPDVPIGTKDDECPEFIVMIKDACRATALKYVPDGVWVDDSGEVYPVVAWMPMPEPYKEQK